MKSDLDFAWSFDRHFELPHADVRVLQRKVSRQAVFSDDLEPFRHAPSLWMVESASCHTGEAVLVDYSYAGSTDEFVVAFAGAGRVEITLPEVTDRELTIWRWQDRLDMIQVRVRGRVHSIYAQLGGANTVPMLAELPQIRPENPTVATLDHLYRTGLLLGS